MSTIRDLVVLNEQIKDVRGDSDIWNKTTFLNLHQIKNQATQNSDLMFSGLYKINGVYLK